MSNKEKCKEIMGRVFGPISANLVDGMTEEECVSVCKKKVEGLLGPSVAEKEFESLA